MPELSYSGYDIRTLYPGRLCQQPTTRISTIPKLNKDTQSIFSTVSALALEWGAAKTALATAKEEHTKPVETVVHNRMLAIACTLISLSAKEWDKVRPVLKDDKVLPEGTIKILARLVGDNDGRTLFERELEPFKAWVEDNAEVKDAPLHYQRVAFLASKHITTWTALKNACLTEDPETIIKNMVGRILRQEPETIRAILEQAENGLLDLETQAQEIELEAQQASLDHMSAASEMVAMVQQINASNE